MKKKVFEGCATALITPFADGKVDYTSFEKIVERQIAAGVSALVFAGTTGEAPTLTAEEWEEICAFAVSAVRRRVPVIVGCGSNSTAEAVKRARRAEELGADAALVVAPYYNKGNSEGIVRNTKYGGDKGGVGERFEGGVHNVIHRGRPSALFRL